MAGLSDEEFSAVAAILRASGPMERFIFKELFDYQVWLAFGNGNFRRQFGMRFGRDVEAGRFPGVSWVGIRKRGRDAEYSYTPPPE